MIDFFKRGIEFNNLAKSMNGMNVMIKQILPKIEASFDYSEFREDLLVLAYTARKGVLDRMELYNWSMESKIIVPTIDKGRITLALALSQTVGNLQIISTQLEMSDVVDEILEKGTAYYEFEKLLPIEVIKKM